MAVTGMAWTTPLGDGVDEVWRRLCAGESGITEVASPHKVRTPLAGVVTPPDYAAADPDERHTELTVRTVRAALADAGLAEPTADLGEELLLVLGTSLGGQLDSPVEPERHWIRRVADRVGVTRTPVCVTTACSAGSDSLLLAQALIRTGRASVCVAGGADVLSEAKRLGHTALGTMSPTGLRAFDAGHDGMLLGEGAGFLVLESAERAAARGARVHARLVGAGSANDAAGLTAPDPSGDSIVAAVGRSLAAAGLRPEDVSVVCAHATGTAANDAVEAASLHRVFAAGSADPVVFGTKGALGHSLGATGAIEGIATILALRDRRVPPIAGLRSPQPGFRLRLADSSRQQVDPGAGLSVTLGFGGFNTSLLFALDEADGHGSAQSAAAFAPPAAPPPVVLGHGTRTVADLSTCSANRPSFYADPLAWLVNAAVEDALEDCRDTLLADRDQVGVLVLTGDRPLPTAGLIAATVARGRVSPLRFAGGNPGILAGLSCIERGFRGPSLVLSAAEDATVATALALAEAWLQDGRARYVVCARHREEAEGEAQTVTCVVLRQAAGADEGVSAADPRALLLAPAVNRLPVDEG
nr:beta-ketoacyl synthase N-terminal-like domain-containing protein [Streptacidiphilus sp. PB12-B1b]